eukprot:526197-Amphidinium_carterae.3
MKSSFGAAATPCAGTGATPGVTSTNPQPGTPAFSAQGGTHTGGGSPDESGGRFKATPAKVPRLDLRTATDSSKAMLAVENWLWLCSSSLNTWGLQAGNIWQNAASHAEAQHAQWCSFTPAQRAMHTTGAYQGFQMSPPLGPVEAHVKSELLTKKILPDKFITYLMSWGASGQDSGVLLLNEPRLPGLAIQRRSSCLRTKAPDRRVARLRQHRVSDSIGVLSQNADIMNWSKELVRYNRQADAAEHGAVATTSLVDMLGPNSSSFASLWVLVDP